MEILLWLVVLVVYLILQLIGSKKKPQPGAPPGRPEDARRLPQGDAGNPLEDALREIREALGAEPERPQPTRRAQTEAPLPPVSPSAPTRLERRLPDEVQRTSPSKGRTSEPAQRKRGGFADEEAFERRLALDPPPVTRTAPAPMPARRPAQAKRPAPKSARERETLLGRLRDPQSVRDAVILSEVFGPPRSRRR